MSQLVDCDEMRYALPLAHDERFDPLAQCTVGHGAAFVLAQPIAKPPWSTSSTTARARARTHAGAAFCAPLIMVDVAPIHENPPISIAPATIGTLRSVPSRAMASPKPMLALASTRSALAPRRMHGRHQAPPIAPPPRQPSSRP
jgi:hypothetical protein